MRQKADAFILNIPRLYIKQFPYAWIVFIALWSWPPNIAYIFLLIPILGMILLRWQHRAWIRKTRDEHASTAGKFYIDQPGIPWGKALRSTLIILAAGAVTGWLLHEQIRLSILQMIIMMTGFAMMYRDSYFFGGIVTYLITASGIAIYYAPGHLDYRLFIRYKEIARIEIRPFQKDKDWSFLARSLNKDDGLLLIPKDPKGFSKRMYEIFIQPRDLEKFKAELPFGML